MTPGILEGLISFVEGRCSENINEKGGGPFEKVVPSLGVESKDSLQR